MPVAHNRGLLVGVTCWCPATSDARAANAIACVRQLLAQTAPSSGGGRDVVIIDNDVAHPLLRRELESAARLPWVTVLQLSPQGGWAGARNRQMGFFLAGEWSHLMMCDQDVRIADAAWIRDVEAVCSHERLEAFMLVSAHEDLRGVVQLHSGRLAWVSREFLGGVHVVSRRSVETVGGYNTTLFPAPWGFHDCEFGLRLRAAGLLDAAGGNYVDPIMRVMTHVDATDAESQHSEMKARVIRDFWPVYQRRADEIAQGKGLFHPVGPGAPTSEG